MRTTFAFSVPLPAARPGSDSDLDVLVWFEPGRSLLDQAGLQLDLIDLLGCKVYVVSEGGISPYLKDDILGEAIPL